MKQYIAFTSEGPATVFAQSMFEAWEQATALFTDVSDVQYHTYADLT